MSILWVKLGWGRPLTAGPGQPLSPRKGQTGMHQMTWAPWRASLAGSFPGWLEEPRKLPRLPFPSVLGSPTLVTQPNAVLCLRCPPVSSSGPRVLNFSSSGTQPKFVQFAGHLSSCTSPCVSLSLGHTWPAVLALHPLQTLSLVAAPLSVVSSETLLPSRPGACMISTAPHRLSYQRAFLLHL